MPEGAKPKKNRRRESPPPMMTVSANGKNKTKLFDSCCADKQA